MKFTHALRYSHYTNSISFNHKITRYSIAGMRYPATELHRGVKLCKQYWAKNLGLRNFAHQQSHKRTKYGARKRWHILGLNDTFDRIHN
jgi:hypothetical protein